MSKSVAPDSQAVSENLKDVAGSTCEGLPKKPAKMSLPFRIDHRGAERRRPLTKHTKVTSSKATAGGVFTGAGAAVRAALHQFEDEESDDGMPKPVHFQSARLQRDFKKDPAQFQSSRLATSLLNETTSVQRYIQRPTKLETTTFNPFTLLGPGESDPFSAIPSDLPRDFLDERMYATRGILQNLVSNFASGESYGKSFALDIMSPLKSNPALLYASIFISMVHTRVLKGISRGTAIEFEAGSRAIQHFTREISDPNRAILDANIWTALLLAYSGRQTTLRVGKKYPRQSFLKELQYIHILCKMDIVIEHVLGLIKIVELLGGLQMIKTPGIAPIISFSGVVGACRTLQKPIFPFMAHSRTFQMDGRLSVSDQEREWVKSTLGHLGSGFWRLWGSSTTAEVNELCIVIQHMCDFTLVVENHIQGRWMAKTFTVIIDQRNFVQHGLMSLKTGQELRDNNATVEEPFYEVCRLAAIVYSFLVIFPLPPVAGPFETLAERLHEELKWISLEDHTILQCRLLVWVFFMGAIASIGLSERSWFLSQMRILLAHMGIGEWEETKRILQSFLWLPSTSDPDGREIWIEMQDGMPSLS